MYREREGKEEPPRAAPSPRGKARGSWLLLASPGPRQVRGGGNEPLFLQLLGALSAAAAVGSGGFSLVLVNKNGCSLETPAAAAGGRRVRSSA